MVESIEFFFFFELYLMDIPRFLAYLNNFYEDNLVLLAFTIYIILINFKSKNN